MTGFTIAILIVSVVASIGANAALCMAIQRHSRGTQRREIFGLKPLNFP
jgi:hypothetical protein